MNQISYISIFSDWYSNITVEFADIIILQLYGHSHRDHFRLITNNKREAVGVQYISPAVSPRISKNPAFRLFELDTNTFNVQNYQNYIINLKSNPGKY